MLQILPFYDRDELVPELPSEDLILSHVTQHDVSKGGKDPVAVLYPVFPIDRGELAKVEEHDRIFLELRLSLHGI